MSFLARSRTGDRGASLIIFAATIGTLLLFVALVIDLGRARSQDQVNDSVVDDAALAGAANIGEDGDAEAACQAAWAYVKANIAQPDFSLAPNCDDLAGECSAPDDPRTASVDIDQQRYTFVHPVPADHQLMGDQPTGDEGATDASCRRFGVMVTDASENIFEQGEIDLASSAVAMQDVTSTTTGGGGGPSTASLVLLDPTACPVLEASGSGRITVHSNEGAAGSIYVDSDGSDCRRRQAVIQASGNAEIGADGAVYYRADDEHATRTTGSGRIIGATPIDEPHLRQPADDTWGPAIESLHDGWATGNGRPDGFQLWSEYIADTRPSIGDPCNIGGGPYSIVVPPDDWYIDCPSGLQLGGNGRVAFTGGNLVMDQPIRAGGSAPVSVNCPSGSFPQSSDSASVASACGTPSSDTIVVVRNGDAFELGGGFAIAWQRTFVYAPNGTVSVGAGNSIHWTAPLGGDFENLLFWSESSADITYGGGSDDNHFEGTFFAPNAPMTVTAGAHLDSPGAQFFVRSFEVSGGSSVDLYPIPGRNLPPEGGSTTTELDGVSLIR